MRRNLVNQDESEAGIELQLYFHSFEINSLDQRTQVFIDIQVNSGQISKTVLARKEMPFL